MIGRPGKYAVVILIAVLLMSSLGGAFGFVICEHGSFSAVHHANHHKGETDTEPKPLPYYPLPENQEDACCDFAVELSVGCLDGKIDFKPPVGEAVPTYPTHPELYAVAGQHQRITVVNHPGIFPLKLLAQRTIVLLI